MAFEGSIAGLIAQFETNPHAASRALRYARDTNLWQFQLAGLQAVAELPESQGLRFVITLLPLENEVLELIAHPTAFGPEAALRILEMIRRIDSQADTKLLRLISGSPGKPLPAPTIDRILDLVDALGDGHRLVPLMMQVFRSSSPYVRARLSLSIGNYHRNKDWLNDRMRDPDPRVRANCVEANWQWNDETAVGLFAAALRDAHHRVIGNGAVGLYFSGDIRSLRVFHQLVAHQNPQRRAAGFWAVGRVRDVRFDLSIHEEDDLASKALLTARGRLLEAAERRRAQPKLGLKVIKLARHPGAPLCRTHLAVEVRHPSGGQLPGLKTIQFELFENGVAILDYSVQERTMKAGTYDIYFDTPESEPQVLRFNIVTPSANGTYCTTDKIDAEALTTDATAPESTPSWDALR